MHYLINILQILGSSILMVLAVGFVITATSEDQRVGGPFFPFLLAVICLFIAELVRLL
jgi:hypothetical protein